MEGRVVLAGVLGALLLGYGLLLSGAPERVRFVQGPMKGLAPQADVISEAPVSALPAEPLTTAEAILPADPNSDAARRLRADGVHAPVLVMDESDGQTTAQSAMRPAAGAFKGSLVPAAGADESASTAARVAQSADEEFAGRFTPQQDVTRARLIGNPAYTLLEGTLLPATLETAINSDLPGFVRATVSRDVRGFDGSTVLAPRGSHLVGQYRSGVALGQSRAFVIWTRLIRPDGVDVQLAAPSTDALGRGGVSGRVDRHFLQRFGGAMLLSLVSAGAAIGGGNDRDTQIIIASTQGAGTQAVQAFTREFDIKPTVHVRQGTAVHAFVTRDIDFSVLMEE
jgi:type IV secretion system protein VirB10